MKALIKDKLAPGIVYVEDQPVPVPGDDEILIKVKSAAICGTDNSAWKWNDAGAGFALKYGAKAPWVLGHECCGVVAEVGKNVHRVKVGDHVALESHIYCGHCHQCLNGDAHNCQELQIYGFSCDGCFAEYTVAPESIAYVMPKSISFEIGSLFEPACCAMFGVQESGVRPGDVVMIYGCGPIGQMAIEIMKACGASKIIAVDIDDYRANQATEMGAIGVNSMKQDLGEVVREVTKGRGGVDVILEISGASAIYDTMFDYLKPEGHVVLLAHPGTPVTLDMMKIHHRGVNLKGVFGRRIWSSWDALAALVDAGKVDLSKIITHRFPLSAGDEAFEQIAKGAGKVIFLPEME